MIHMTVHLTFSAFWIKAGWPVYRPIVIIHKAISMTYSFEYLSCFFIPEQQVEVGKRDIYLFRKL